MSFQKMLDRYMSDLQEFDLEVFFHDDTLSGIVSLSFNM